MGERLRCGALVRGGNPVPLLSDWSRSSTASGAIHFVAVMRGFNSVREENQEGNLPRGFCFKAWRRVVASTLS